MNVSTKSTFIIIISLKYVVIIFHIYKIFEIKKFFVVVILIRTYIYTLSTYFLNIKNEKINFIVPSYTIYIDDLFFKIIE